jgi:hypothetical protein
MLAVRAEIRLRPLLIMSNYDIGLWAGLLVRERPTSMSDPDTRIKFSGLLGIPGNNNCLNSYRNSHGHLVRILVIKQHLFYVVR